MAIARAVKLKEGILLIGDIVILYGSLLLMLFIRYGDLNAPLPRHHLIPFSVLFLVWILIFYIAGLYDLRSTTHLRAIDEKFLPAIAVSLACSVVFFYFLYFLPGFGLAPKTNLLIFALIASTALYAWRSIYGVFVHTREAIHRLLLIGNGPAMTELAEHLRSNPQLGYAVCETIPTISGTETNFSELERIISKERITMVVFKAEVMQNVALVAFLYRAFPDESQIVELLRIYEEIFRKIPLGELAGGRFVEGIAKTHPIYDRLKRVVEFVVVLALGIALLPPALLIAIVIKLTSRGSAFFTQVRVGRHEKRFVLWKFRTMVTDAEKDGPTWATPHDKRITKVGALLRASHLDELPQLWNIIRGELSLVGPRPERPEFVSILEKQIPYYHLRHLVKPGLTGWAQLNYRYAASALETSKKLEYDLYYIKNRSVWLELGTVLKTIKRLFVNAL